MERLGNVQSRGVPLLFYSPSSTESAKRGENGRLVRKKKRKRNRRGASTGRQWRSRERGDGAQWEKEEKKITYTVAPFPFLPERAPEAKSMKKEGEKKASRKQI